MPAAMHVLLVLVVFLDGVCLGVLVGPVLKTRAVFWFGPGGRERRRLMAFILKVRLIRFLVRRFIDTERTIGGRRM